jgi:hypothetical protein
MFALSLHHSYQPSDRQDNLWLSASFVGSNFLGVNGDVVPCNGPYRLNQYILPRL